MSQVSPLLVHRVARGWTQDDLASRAGVARATIAKIERGIHRPRRATAGALARTLGVDPDELFGGER